MGLMCEQYNTWSSTGLPVCMQALRSRQDRVGEEQSGGRWK